MSRPSGDDIRAAMKRKALEKGKQKTEESPKRQKLTGPPPGGPGGAPRRKIGIVIGSRRDPVPAEEVPVARAPAERSLAERASAERAPSGGASAERAPSGGRASMDIDRLPLSVVIQPAGPRSVPSAATPRVQPEVGATVPATGDSASREGGGKSPDEVGAWLEASGGWTYRARVNGLDSAFRDAEAARGLARGLLIPVDVIEKSGLSVREMVDKPFCLFAELLHHLVGMRSLVLRHNETRQRFERRAKSADERASKAVEERDGARKELARLRDLQSKEREHSALVLKEREGALQKEIKLASELKASLSRAEAESRKAEGLRLKEEERASAAAREVVAEGERAAAAERRELAAKKEAENSERREKAAEERALAAECRASEAEARSAQAVEEYKSSPAFKDELAEFSIEAYSLGFEYCKGMVRERFPDLNLQVIVADGGEGTSAVGAEEAITEGGKEGRAEAAPAPSFQLIPEAPPVPEPAAEVCPAVEADGDEVVEVPPPSAPSPSSTVAAPGAE